MSQEVQDMNVLFGEDETAVERGIWVSHANGPQFRICAATDSNPQYVRVKERVLKPHRRALSHDAMDEKRASDLLMQVYAECVIVDWKDVFLDGKRVPFSKKECLRMLKLFPKLWRWLRAEATEGAHFMVVTEEEEGNSPSVSSTPSSGVL